MATLERIYTIPLSDAYEYIRTKRARRAIKLVREFALRHMKAEEAKISEGVNSLVFRDGMQKPPRRIKVRIAKGDDSVAKVWLVGEEEKIKEASEKKKKESEAKAAEAKKKEEASKPKPAEKKAEAAPAKAEAPKQVPSPAPSQQKK